MNNRGVNGNAERTILMPLSVCQPAPTDCQNVSLFGSAFGFGAEISKVGLLPVGADCF
jgi:hypothetical protein